MTAFEHYRQRERMGRITGAAVAVALHAAVVVFLLQFQPVRSAITQAVPIMVSLITLPAPVVETPKERLRPLPVNPRPLPAEPHTQPAELAREPAPLIAAASEAAAPPAAPAPQPAAASAAPAAAVPVPAVPAPAPIVPPSFNAAYLDNPAPEYPADSRRRGQQGKVLLHVLVGVAGTADKVEIRTSSGFDRLDEAALEAVRRWRFVPAQQGNSPVAAWVLVPIRFSLES